jgi:hypothetical protein
MTMYKERAELETKQVMLRYGGLSMKQLIYPSEMNIDAAQDLLVNPILKQHNTADDSSSFFSSFRRKLKEKFSSLSQKHEERTSYDENEAKIRSQLIDRQADAAFSRSSPVHEKQVRMPVAVIRKSSVSARKIDDSPLANEKLAVSPSNSPQNTSTSHGHVIDMQQLSKSPALNRLKNSPTLASGYDDPHKSVSSVKIATNNASRAEYRSAAIQNPGMKHSLKDAVSDNSERTHKAESISSKGSSRPESADSGSLHSSREAQEGRLPAQYQFFRKRQSGSTAVPKLSLMTPRQSDIAGPRYHMRRDVSITDTTQCIWLQKASGPLSDRCVACGLHILDTESLTTSCRIHVDFDVRVELVKLTDRHRISGIQIALKGQVSSVQSAADFIFGIIDNLRQITITFHQFDSTNPGITVSENEDAILKDLRKQLKRLDQLPSFWPIDVDAKMLDLEVPDAMSPKSPKNVHFRSLQNPIMVVAIVSEIDRHFVDVIAGNMKSVAEHIGLRV